MTQERFEYLIAGYTSGVLTQEEWEELRAAIADGASSDRLLGHISERLERGGVHPDWNPALEAGIWDAIVRGVKDGQVMSMGEEVADKRGIVRKMPGIRQRWVRYGAVAACVLCFAGLALLWRTERAVKPVAGTTVAVVKDVAPGGNRAVLTLANGQQIILDSSSNGQIAQQGMTKVIKLNGLISYKGASAGGEVLYNTISTPRGGQYELVLPDGSLVWLNSASTLRFPTAFAGSRREVELHGEGFFEIAKDAARPFTVAVNDMRVRVMGTSFNTMAYPDEGSVNTTLVDGAVIVEEGELKKQLEPGQQAAVEEGGQRVSVSRADVRKVTAWRSGLFEFDNMDLEAVMRQLSRWYDIEVEYKVKPDRTPLGGSISRNLHLKEVLAMVEATGINHFNIEGKKVTVLP